MSVDQLVSFDIRSAFSRHAQHKPWSSAMITNTLGPLWSYWPACFFALVSPRPRPKPSAKATSVAHLTILALCLSFAQSLLRLCSSSWSLDFGKTRDLERSRVLRTATRWRGQFSAGAATALYCCERTAPHLTWAAAHLSLKRLKAALAHSAFNQFASFSVQSANQPWSKFHETCP